MEKSIFQLRKMSQFLGFSLLLGLYSCSGNKVKLEERDNSDSIKRDYLVRDASHSTRPGWISDPQDWAIQKEESDSAKDHRFFSYETTPKVDREVACDLAKSQAKADIASEIASFIEKTLGESKSGRASVDPETPGARKLREFIEVTLADKTQALIHGASIVKTYWEKREFQKALGASYDYTGFTCAVLIKMENSVLKAAIAKAREEVVNAADEEVKQNVKDALDRVEEKFEKTRKGEL